MRYAILVLACLLLPFSLPAQTAVQKARQAAQAASVQESATAAQAEDAMPAPVPSDQAPAMDHSGHQPAADHSGHAMPGEAPADQAPAMDHSGHQPPAQHAGHEAAATPAEQGDAEAMHAGHGNGSAPAEHVHPAPAPEPEPGVGVTEKLGQHIAAEARFLDEAGRPVTIGEIVDKPTIIVPIYFSCPNVCAIIQSSLTQVLPDVKLTPGKDFQVVSVSFDETDTPELAANQKRNYLAAMDFKYPESGWRFLTGDEKNIRMLTDSLGFGFRRSGKDFLHPVAIMAVSPKGKIVRYLYGTKPLAFDLTMAATEAGKEQIGLSVKRVLAYCFSYDPEGKRYAFNFMKITATGILVILGVLLVALLIAGPKKRKPRN